MRWGPLVIPVFLHLSHSVLVTFSSGFSIHHAQARTMGTLVVTGSQVKEASLVKPTSECCSAMFPRSIPEAQLFALSKLSRNHLEEIPREM